MAAEVQSVRALQNNRFLVELRAAVAGPRDRTTLIAICDESGSMAGAPFKSCLSGLRNLVAIQSPLTVILFSSNARAVIVRNVSDVDAIQQRGGGTHFGPPITGLKTILPKLEGFVEVVMFTDGEGASADWSDEPLINERCRFHVIGLGAFADTAALLGIRRLGYEPGTFGFAKTPAELATKITEAAEFSRNQAVVRYRGQARRVFEDEPIRVIVDSLDPSLGETSVPVLPSTFDDEMQSVRERLRALAENPTAEALTALREDFNQAVEQKTSAGLTRLEYREIVDIATALNDVAFVLRQHRGSTLPNEALALINERVLEVVTRRFMKLADKRGAAGEARLVAEDARIEELAAEFVAADLADEPH
jgi:hypothetical protein